MKSKGIDFALFQFFVDEIQTLRSRADSSLLLSQARELRNALLEEGTPEEDLPNLEGNAGAAWFKRWKKRFRISKKAGGMQLKVPWKRVLSRCHTHLSNIFRVRTFWDLVHPGRKIRFVSLDQKPAWFNYSERSGNFGQKGQKPITVRENYAKARERYSIFTCVDSATEYSAERSEADAAPPHVFILFKGKKKGTILRDLLAGVDLPPWLHLQVQECGSYRDEDVIESLQKILPVATSTEQSTVVLLDWYAAHRSPDVIDFIEKRGHIVLFHGGGCTPFTQVNDTHLHANLTRLLIKLENQLTHDARVDMHLNYKNGIPTLSRHDICHIVTTAWRMIDHKYVAGKGYMQTGPCLPRSGPIRHDQVAPDLATVLDEIDPPVDVQEVGQRLRDDAKAFVMAGYPRKWSKWEHVKRLISEHDSLDDPVEEGFEAYDYDYAHDDRGDDDKPDDGKPDVGNDNGENDSDTDGGKDTEGERESDGSEGDGHGGDVECEGGDDEGVVPLADADGAVVELEQKTPEPNVEAAREVLIDDARRRRDNVLLRRLLAERAKETKYKRSAATDVAQTLQKRALAEKAVAEQKRKHARREEQKAALSIELAAERKAEAMARHAELRVISLQQSYRMRLEEVARGAARKKWQAEQKWLQTEYPRDLYRSLRRCIVSKTDTERNSFKLHLRDLAQQNWFRYMPRAPALWDVDKTLLIRFGDAWLTSGVNEPVA